MTAAQKEHPWLVLRVDNNSDALRIDSWLSRRVKELSRRQAQEMISSGEITVNGSQTKKSRVPSPGDEVIIWQEPSPAFFCPAEDPDLELKVLYEDDCLLAVEKPSRIASVPLSPDEIGTLAGALADRYRECAPLGKRPGDGGLIQRLDRETSGVMLAARSERAFELLNEIQSRNGIEKRYLALVRASKELPQIVDVPLASSGPGGKKVKPSKNGEPAITRLKSIGVFNNRLLVEATIFKGKRHQIRVHLAHTGHPIIGDQLYGIDPSLKETPRLMLHASKVILNHPVTGEPLKITSPLPGDFGIEKQINER